MNKAIALLLTASLLLAGCTELNTDDLITDAEVVIEINEELALEKINDLVTIDEGESFGMSMAMAMDAEEMASSGMELDENSTITSTQVQAWNSDGIHTSTTTTLSGDVGAMTMIISSTQIGNALHASVGYTVVQNPDTTASQEEIDEFMMMETMLPPVTHYSMTTATTHVQVIAQMAEEMDDSDDFSAMSMLELLKDIQEHGEFSMAELSDDGLQFLDVSFSGIDTITPEEAIEDCDGDGNGGVSWAEFISEDCDDTDEADMAALEEAFNAADTNDDGELTVDEAGAYIQAVSTYYGDDETIEMSIGLDALGDVKQWTMQTEEGDITVTILSDEAVNALMVAPETAEAVALPFTLTSGDDAWDEEEDDGMEDMFVCDDGEEIPWSWVNDGEEDCSGGEDEDQDDGSEEMFVCDDGEEIPFDWVNDGEEDCDGGEDEGYLWVDSYDHCDDGDGLSSLDCWINDWDEDGDGVPEDSNSYWNYECEELTDGTWECATDHINYYDECEYEDTNYYECWLTEWDTDGNGTYDLGSDGYWDDECEALENGKWACERYEDDEEITPEAVLEMFDADGDDHLSWQEFWDAWTEDEEATEEAESALMEAFATADEDEDELLSVTELEAFIVSVMEMEISDDEEEDNEGEQEGWHLDSAMDMAFEGAMDDYKIELATCTSEYVDDEEVTTCETVLSVAVSDAVAGSNIEFDDVDESGTLSVGDIIYVGEVAEEWDTVRLYSISANAYSDENPMNDMPGFTGVLATLSLLGAALIRRKD